jgi:tetratricopeptide (TPR) repeat protein
MNFKTQSSSALVKTWTLLLITGFFLFNTAFAGWDEGVAAFKSKNFKMAAKEFKAHTMTDPEDWRGHYMLGLSQFNIGMPPTIYLKSFQSAYDLNPNDLTLKKAMKRALKTTGDIQVAAVQYMYGTTALKLGSKGTSKQAYQKALELEPANKDYKAAVRSLN